MEEKRVCSSCGASMPADAVFCAECGQKQEIPAPQVQPNFVEEIKTDSVAAPEAVVEKAPEIPSQPVSQPVPPAYTVQQPPVQPAAQPQSYQQPQSYPQQPQSYAPQQSYYQPQPAPAAVPQKPKKKFPWIFTVLWLGMLGFVAFWTYYMFAPGYEPEITIDTVRIVAYVVTVVLMVYILNLKLATKKLRVLPTIFLVIVLLASILLFSTYELMDGEALHDWLSPITESFLPEF
jgi:hypothetical protein